MSESSRRKKNLILRQLHLLPLRIYLVDEQSPSESCSYSLELWKDENMVSMTESLIKSPHRSGEKYDMLQFKGVRFVFDVDALFKERSSSSIKLKLKQKTGNQQIVKDQFHLHLFYYNYEFMRDKFVKQKQNSVGKINHNIINYSFSAIYGQPLQNIFSNRQTNNRRQILLEDIHADKKNLKYGQLFQQKQGKSLNTIFLIEAVAQTGVSKPERSIDLNSSILESPLKFDNISTNVQIPDESQIQADDARKIMRSIVDELPFQGWDSNLIDHELVEELAHFSKNTLFWLMMILSGCAIYFLMHPLNKI